ncbi:DUF1833 domain-containing protein [Cereibacter sphaeroides]|nr:DUF1833 domain-containing protein [Cereibacter sphaeroides]MCA2013524.1 DUF1833 domain-containing protein [Cereibacter sphaeroides]
MSRDIPADADAFAEASDAVWLPFVQIDHPALGEPIRVVADVLPYSWQGATWVPYPFGFRRLTDEDAMPETRLVIQNIDRRLGNALRGLSGRATVSFWLLTSADFDLSLDPREPLGTVTPLYSFTNYDLTDVTIDPIQISGRVTLRDYSTEPWPGIRATQDRFPGLFV